MATLRTLLRPREAKAALAVWAILPTLFLFFALTLAVDPSAHLDRVRVGTVILDQDVATPGGPVSIGAALAGGLHEKLGLEVVPYASEGALRDAVLARDVAGGVVVPPGMTAAAMAGTPVELTVVRSDANDPFSSSFTSNLAAQLTANVNALLPALASGGEPATPPVVTVVPDTVAVTPDFRFATIPATLVLPLWVASLAFVVLLTRAAAAARAADGPVRSGLAELAVAVAGAAVVAAVVTLDVALFALRTDFDLVGLFAILWLGLTATAWLLQGTLRLAGLAGGALLGLLALFVQQPVSGATFPPSFAPDVVRWLEPVAPLRYLVEGVRNALVGGSTMPAMAAGLVAIAVAGLGLYAVGLAVAAARHERRSMPTTAPAH